MTGRIIESPWVMKAVDLMHFPRLSSQNKHFIVFQDLFTKWVELKPIRAATEKSVSPAFEELILFRWNTPTYALNDNGSEFKNNCWHATLKKYHIKRIKIPANYPKGNSQSSRESK